MPFLPKGAEWIVILLVVLLIFGPKNLPKLGSAIGKTVSNLRSGMNEGKKKAEDEAVKAEGDEPESKDVPAEIEGEIETIEEVEEGDEADSDDRSAQAEAPEKSEDAPKKVRRVVKKKVVEESVEAD